MFQNFGNMQNFQFNPTPIEVKRFNAQQIPERFYYTILAPKILCMNSNYTSSLTIHDAKCEFKELIVVRVSIEDKAGFMEPMSIDVAIKPNETEVVSIPVGDLIDDSFKLVVTGISGITMKHEEDLIIQTRTHAILIQTDKATYKPKDCIKYRVLVLDSEMKAAEINDKKLSIRFTDPCRNVMKELHNVETVNGVFSGEFQLSDVPVFGDWQIRASVGEQGKTKTIEVAEYVLPKFEVAIEGDDCFSLADENIRCVIRGKYTNGQPLKGTAIVSIFGCRTSWGGFGKLTNSIMNTADALAKKTIVFRGRETIEFNIQNELKFQQSCFERVDIIKAEITESLTGLSRSVEKPVTIYRDTYKITTDLRSEDIKPGSALDVTVSVRKRNGSKLSIIDPSKKLVTVIRRSLESMMFISNVIETIHEMNEDGDACFSMYIGENDRNFSLTVKYDHQETHLGTFMAMSPVNTIPEHVILRAKLLTERCSIDKDVEVEVRSSNVFPSYTYVIVGRGRILATQTIIPEFCETSRPDYRHQFSFRPSFECAPKAEIIVYFIRDNEIKSTRLTLDLKDDFKNFIDLDVAPETSKPGQSVDINIRTNPNSYIGLLGVDKSVLLLKGGNDLTSDEIWSSMESYYLDTIGGAFGNPKRLPNHERDFSDAGLITFTNVQMGNATNALFGANNTLFGGFGCVPTSATNLGNQPFAGNFMSAQIIDQPIVKPVIRKKFPETWIWECIDDESSAGLLSLKKKVPDSLTTWLLTGFSIDPINGLAITKKPAELCVQQEFHISINLPYLVKRGEILTIPCSIFNYLPKDIEAQIILENEHNEFEFIDSAVNESIYPEIMKQQFRKKKLTVRSEDAVNALFTIRPIKIGLISLKVSALSITASDCVVKTLNVECEGVKQFVNKAAYIDLREKTQIEPIDLSIEVPKIALPDSTRIEITCVGDLLGGTIKNLHQLIRIPYGCGEQNMLNFVPNIVVLNYLKNTHQLTAEIETRAKKYMEIGYQRELTYKHKDGSFSAFGDSDKSGSTWLTAFVARSFRQAAEHITIDQTIIEMALKWLSATQAPDGSFIEKGSICHKEIQSGSSNGVALTAYVLTAFLVNKDINNKYESTIQKALNNIVESTQICSDVYALAVSAYALQLANHESKNIVIDRLKGLAKVEGNWKWWDKQSLTLNVEVTAYALLALHLGNQDFECWPILRWLLNQRNSNGGFAGTQDTIVGIEALAAFVAKIATNENDVKVEITTPNDTRFNFEVNRGNSFVLQSQLLSPDVKTVRINASGKGFALLELGYRYNIDTPEPAAAFSLKPEGKLLSSGHMSLEVTATYVPPEGKDLVKQSNMVILEMALPSGFVINLELLNELKSKLKLVKRIETKNSDTTAVLYFDYLTSEPVTLTIDGFREHFVEERKPASVLIYDYYDNALTAREFYTLQTNYSTLRADAVSEVVRKSDKLIAITDLAVNGTLKIIEDEQYYKFLAAMQKMYISSILKNKDDRNLPLFTENRNIRSAIKVRCSNSSARQWIEKWVPKIPIEELWAGANLHVIDFNKLPKPIIANIWCPGVTGSMAEIIQLLQTCNSELNTAKWSMIKRKTNERGSSIKVEIDKAAKTYLESRKNRLCFGVTMAVVYFPKNAGAKQKLNVNEDNPLPFTDTESESEAETET